MRPLASSCFLITREFAKSLALPQTWSYGSAIKNLPANAGDLGLIPGLGRSPEEGNDNPLEYSCLGNSMDRGAWQATVHRVAKESDTTWQLSNNPRNTELVPPHLISLHLTGFCGGSDGKESACNSGDLGLIPGLGRSPGEGHGNPLQYFCQENPHGQRSLAG